MNNFELQKEIMKMLIELQAKDPSKIEYLNKYVDSMLSDDNK